jgi:anthranilate phosphoribosyltransferase
MSEDTPEGAGGRGHLSEIGEIVNPLLARVLDGDWLSSVETRSIFDLLFEKDDSGLYWLAVSTALHARGESQEELEGICESIAALIDSEAAPAADLDFNGTGRRPYATINVGTCASFVAAGAGAIVAKHGSGAVTGHLGSMDLVGAFGLDRAWPADRELVAADLTLGGVTFVHNFLRSGRAHTRLKYLTTLHEIGLRMTSPFHLIGGVPQVVPTRSRLFGTFSLAHHQRLAALLRKRHEAFVVVTAADGLDEVSVVAESTMTISQSGGETETIVISPSDVGCPQRDTADLIVDGPEERMTRFVRVLADCDDGALADLVVANVAVGLWIAGAASSTDDGASRAREALASRRPWKTFCAATARAGQAEQLRIVCDRAGVAAELA